MTPARGLDRWIEDRDASRAPKATGEFDVFHERNSGEAAQFLKNIAPDENGLIAVKCAAMSGEKSSNGFQPHQAGMAPVEFSKEGSANDSRILEGDLDRFEVRVVQAGVAMLEKDCVARAGSGAQIHLLATIRSGAGDKRRARGQRDPLRFFVAGSIHDDRLRDPFQLREDRQERFQIIRVAPGRDDDTDSQMRLRTFGALVHCGFFSRRLRARSSARRSDAVRLLIPDLEIFSSTGSMDS